MIADLYIAEILFRLNVYNVMKSKQC